MFYLGSSAFICGSFSLLRSADGFDVSLFGYGGEKLVRLALFVQSLLQQARRLGVPQLLGVGAYAPVRGHFIVLHPLGRTYDRGVPHHGRGILLQYVLALFNDAPDALALFTFGLFAVQTEYLLEAPYVFSGLLQMFL